MVKRWAVISAGVVDNVILWDGSTPWSPPAGSTVVELPEGSRVGTGWTWDGVVFQPPAEP